MSQFVAFNFTDCSPNQNPFTVPNQNVCICCLVEDVPYVRFSSCRHTSFFEYFFRIQMEGDAMVCYKCHKLLKTIEEFRRQVDESHLILRGELSHKEPINKVYKFEFSPLEVTYTDNGSVDINVKNNISGNINSDTENDLKNNDNYFTTDIEVKLERESSDGENDLPLAVIKEEIEKVTSKKKKVRNKKSGFDAKYEGKIRIIELSKKEMVEERKREALKTAYVNLPYKCESCITGFDHELTLKDHMEKRHIQKNGSFVCSICNSVLSSVTSYKEHTKRHTRRYECQSCGKRFSNIYTVVKHYNDNHGTISTEYACQQCGFFTQSHRSYRYHRDKHKEKPQCTECGNTFVNNTALKIHMYTIHKLSSRVYSCSICNKVYNAKSGLLAHEASAHGGAQSAYCETCRVHFRTAHNLRHHLKTHSRHISDTDKRFMCHECTTKFLTKSSLQEHIDWVHLKNTKYECEKCFKTFKNGSSLKKHQSFVHEKKRPPRNKICDHCGRGFTTLSILRSHVRTHTGERPLRCVRCPASFAHAAALYTHNKTLHRHTISTSLKAD